MSSGSYFTLYRKYNTRADEREFAEILGRYVKENKEHDYSDEKKSDDEYAEDIPLVLDVMHGVHDSEYDEESKTWKDVKDHSVNGQRKRFQAILAKDGSCLDELLNWGFGSGFSCLKNQWNLNGYKQNQCQHIIDLNTAKSMLHACNYLLSGNWSDQFEEILDNEWIDVFATGNDGASYWKYVYRNDKKRYKEICSEEDDFANEVEWQLKRMKLALEAFVCSEKDYSQSNATELVLVYTAW